MKYLVIVFFFFITQEGLKCQSFFSVQNYGSLSEKEAAGAVGSFNPWFGSRLGYSIVGEGNVSNGFFVNGQFQLPLEFLTNSNQFKVPLVTNIGAFKSKVDFDDLSEVAAVISDLASQNSGVSIGLHPAYDLTKRSYSSIYGQLDGKWNRFIDEETDNSTDVYQFRIGIGYEFGLINDVLNNGNRVSRLLFSVNPIYSIYQTGDLESIFSSETNSNFWIELTGIYRIATGIGLVVEYIAGEEIEAPLNVGVLFAFEQ
ncbi:hypothetical protein CEQ90_15040 [Lewinellaceae bacterium SD302]|nr:hypothetical protein CEQ90_15040 [Lewinellaceae bacterium SD302]